MLREAEIETGEDVPPASVGCADRIGMARLTKMAVSGADLRPLWQDLINKLMDGTAEAGEGLDLSLIAQLLGDKQAGLAIQNEVLASHQLFRLPCQEKPQLRVLALAAATDMGGNTPIEFLLQDSGIELTTLYVIPQVELAQKLPEHDVAIVVASDSEDCRDALTKISQASAKWPRPLLNQPHLVCNLDRDKLHHLLGGVEGLQIPATVAATREQLSGLSRSAVAIEDIAAGIAFPIIVRPRGSHAGAGLAKIDGAAEMNRYLEDRHEQQFFISRFVDYSSDDGLFRKYRIVFVDGKPYACHMAIADRWDIWYLNAGMSLSAEKRLEEELFIRDFDIDFAQRHAVALKGLADRVALDYFLLDCAEAKDGSLLIFEVDNSAIVHDMDPTDIFPYKPPQTRKIFEAFTAMLALRAQQGRECAG
jgi:glutathione synthase/RimK-type ligase-like ATP-grasp enzyme